MTKNVVMLNQFMQKVMSLHADFAASGMPVGVSGSTNVLTDVLDKLLRNAIAFAVEYAKQKPDTTELHNLAEQLESLLLALKLNSHIPSARLDGLLTDLQPIAALAQHS